MGLKKSGVEPTPIQDLNFEKSIFGQEVSQRDPNLRLHETMGRCDLRPYPLGHSTGVLTQCKIVARVVTTGEQKILGTAFSDPNCITE